MKRGTLLRFLPLLLLALASCSRDPKVQAQRYLTNGNKFFDKSKFKEASIMYRKALSKDQRFGEAYYRLALTDLKLAAYGDAAGHLRRAVELLPDNADAPTKLADIYVLASTQDQQHSRQLLEEASQLADKLIAKDPNSYDGHRLYGQIALLKRDAKTAVEELGLANQVKPFQVDLVLTLFQALVLDHQSAAAEKLARELLDKEKTFAPMYDRLYLQYMVEKRLNDAEQVLKLKVENNPKAAAYLLQLAAHYFVVKRRPDMDAVMRQLADEKQFPDGHLLAGDFYFFRLREFELARKEYEAGSAAFPRDKAAYQKRLVELFASTGSSEQANQLLAAILKENPKDSDAIAMRAALMLTTGNRDQINMALTDFQSLVAKNPTNHLLQFNLARAFLAKGEIEPARLRLEEAIKLRPDFVAARELLARVYMAKSDAAKALQVAEELLNVDRNNLSGHLTRSAALLALNQTDKAREELDLITRSYPQNPDARYQVGLLAWQDKDYRKAEQIFSALYRDNPRDGRGLLGVTETLAAQNRMDEAIKELDKAVAAEPERRDLRLGRANFYVRAQRYDEAIAAYKGLLEKEPASSDLLYKLGETYRRKGDINLAADTFRKSSQAAPNSTLPLLQLGLILETIGPADQAKAVYEQILKIDPNHAIALNNLAYAKAEEGTDLDSALRMAQHASQILPNAPAMADTLGWIYIKKNLSADAIRIFSDLVQKEPANATFRYHYGMALLQKGDKPSARRELQAALKNKPSKDETAKIEDLLTKL